MLCALAGAELLQHNSREIETWRRVSTGERKMERERERDR